MFSMNMWIDFDRPVDAIDDYVEFDLLKLKSNGKEYWFTANGGIVKNDNAFTIQFYMKAQNMAWDVFDDMREFAQLLKNGSVNVEQIVDCRISVRDAFDAPRMVGIRKLQFNYDFTRQAYYVDENVLHSFSFQRQNAEKLHGCMEYRLMREEAVKRMEKLGLNKKIIDEFIKHGRPTCSNMGGAGCRYLADDEEKFIIDDLNSLCVYHLVESNTRFGKHIAFLYVSSDMDEWEYDEDNLENGMCMAYVYNCDAPDLSEYGSIGIQRTDKGCLVRTF